MAATTQRSAAPSRRGAASTRSTATTQSTASTRSTASAPLITSSCSTELVPAGSNLVVLRGLIRRDPEFRVLASGDELMSLDLTVRSDDGPAESVPVVWPNPAAAAVKFVEGDDVVVVGRIRRRFFRAGGSTATRTEVHADKILSARSGVRIRTALEPRVEDLNL
jgi:single-strand DNA-binding protein